jgi:predicted RNA-binding Zn-ribbon protein involved in translation (DUF1610 family)
MPEDADRRPYCLACDRPIDGPAHVYRCPHCGSYNVTRVPLTDRQRQEDAAARARKVMPVGHISPYKYLFPRPPKGVPKALWERLRPLRFFVIPVLILIYATAITLIGSLVADMRRTGRFPLAAPPAWQKTLRHAFPAVMIVTSAGITLLPYLARRRLRRFEQGILADDHEHCLECGYSLRGLPAEHCCPECGQPYSIAAVKETWRRYFEAQKNKK